MKPRDDRFKMPKFSAQDTSIRNSGSRINNLMRPGEDIVLSRTLRRSMDLEQQKKYEQAIKD